MRHMEAFRKGNSQREFHQSFRSQSAMEYLMTYGWAILIIAVVLAALFELGVFNPMTFAPKASPGSCQVVRPEGAGTTNFISLEGECNGELPQYVAQFNGNAYISGQNAFAFPITIVMWVDPSAYNTNSNLAELMYADSGDYQAFIANSGVNGCTYTGELNFWNPNDGNECNNIITPLNSWSFIVFESNSTSTTFYVNNKSYQENGVTNIVSSKSSTGWWLAGPYHNYFEGLITNVQLYSAALSSNDIKALYQEGIGGSPINIQSLVGWWPLNGNSNDYSGNGNNGVPTGVTYTSNWYSGYSAP